MASSAQHNIMSVDVEDWFHILELEGGYERSDWGSLESRVERNTEGLLELFERLETRATFFIVGWVAWKYPQLVRAIAKAGHEIGSHSFWHEVIPRHDRDTLTADLGRSRRLLEDISGTPVRGFRAPGGSITPDGAWAFDVMLEQGYSYDSSLCPGISSHGGYPSPHFGPHTIRCQGGTLAAVTAADLHAPHDLRIPIGPVQVDSGACDRPRSIRTHEAGPVGGGGRVRMKNENQGREDVEHHGKRLE